jgi:hypothetical protein
MKPYNKQEFNQVCAEFLGWEQGEDGYYNRDMHHDYSFVKPDEMKFHSDWNWIMEVVEKINDTPIEDDFIECIEAKYLIFQRLGKTYKLAVVEAIWQFLNWFNEQKQ